MEMEPDCCLEVLHKLHMCLCTETETRQLYKPLKKLAYQPVLGDILEEIGLRQTIKLLKKQLLLYRFAKELATRWSERSNLGPRPIPGPAGLCLP
ncbi:RNA polymerase II transcription factor SIII subunit A3-like-2 [Cricetulus griseus]|uniref:RNA polymerase II transcription factor SIII subunit A3-like-2 n=1 Tax=Cricetulus griseus TaxID=10029 RepID=G3I2K3_CRIGR|nr:RNA polymerase II transcription factor SIII subunit A3-like-2 [Cricetulus griseus]